MTIKPFLNVIAALAIGAMTLNANANSVGFDQVQLSLDGGQVSITVSYDFTDFSMFGGGLDLIYETGALELESYTQADLSGTDAQAAASPIGSFQSAGLYAGFGIGTFDFFSGMNSAGNIGTFVFNVVGPSSGGTPCGGILCLSVNSFNPFISLAGADVSAELLANGNSVAYLTPIPVPAAVWLMLGGLGALLNFQRKSV